MSKRPRGSSGFKEKERDNKRTTQSVLEEHVRELQESVRKYELKLATVQKELHIASKLLHQARSRSNSGFDVSSSSSDDDSSKTTQIRCKCGCPSAKCSSCGFCAVDHCVCDPFANIDMEVDQNDGNNLSNDVNSLPQHSAPILIRRQVKPSETARVAGVRHHEEPNDTTSIRPSLSQTSVADTSSVPSSIEVRTSTAVQRLLQVKTQFFDNVFRRKPRCLLLRQDGSDTSVATASLDGSLNFWHLSGHAHGSSIKSVECWSSADLRHSSWVEDMCWSPCGGAVAVCFNNDKDDECQLLLLRRKPHAVSGSADKQFTSSHCVGRPHKGAVSTLQWTYAGSHLISGGLDHALVLWSNLLTEAPVTQTVVHALHSSAVLSICPLRGSDAVASGGADKKVLIWSLDKQRLLTKMKMEDRVNSVLQNPVDPNLLLVSVMSRSNQLQLFDLRLQPRHCQLSFSATPPLSLSQYIVPRWAPFGSMVSGGSLDGRVNLWDIRYANIDEPSDTLSVHKARVLCAEWHPASTCEQGVLLSMSSDKQLGLHSFKLRSSQA